MISRYFRKILFLLLAISKICLSQQDYIQKTYNINDGLVQSSVNTTFLDKTGFLWIGTDKGLSRFDGKNFRNYTSPDELFSQPIISIQQDFKNILLLLTGNGELWQFDGETFRKHELLSTNKDIEFTSLILIEDYLLLGSQTNGFFKISRDTTINFSVADGLYSKSIIRFSYDRMKNINIISEGGVNQFRNNQILPLFKNEKLSYSNLIQHSKGNYWCTVDGEGIYRREEGKWIQKVVVRDIPFNSMIEDSTTVIWVASDVLLHRIIDNSFGDVYVFNDLTMGVSSLNLDSSHNLWVGTFGNGLKKITKNLFDNFLPLKNFPGFFALALYQDSNNNSWVTPYQEGVVVFGNRYNHYTTNNGLPDNLVHSVCEYENQTLVATDKGIVVFDNGAFKKFIKETSPIPGRPAQMLVDSRDQLWVATRTNGLFRLIENEWKEFELNFPSGIKSVRAIFEDSKKVMWFITYTDGVYVFDGIKLNHLDESKGLTTNKCVTITEDQEKRIWLGSLKGIHIFEEYKLVDTLTTADGLISDIVYSLASYKNTVMVGTPDGLGIYSSGRFRFFTTADGLASNDISSNKMLINNDGKIVFGTNYGFSVFDIENYLNKNRDYNFILSEVISDYDTTSINSLDSAELRNKWLFSSSVDKILFEYSPINFSDLSFIYRYKQSRNGEEGDWVTSASSTIENYDCSPGEYNCIFQAKAFGDEWQTVDKIHYTIAYPFYRTKLFYSILLMLGVFAGVFFFYWQDRKEKLRIEQKYKSSSLSKDRIKQLKEEIEEVVDGKKLYLDPDLTLQKLSLKMNIPKEHLSQVINSEFQQGFNDYINRKRVLDASKLLLINGKDGQQIIQIAYEVGFNNKSSFNNAFKKLTGYTPSEYRKKHHQK